MKNKTETERKREGERKTRIIKGGNHVQSKSTSGSET